jgi:hypothetical protein
LTPTDQLTPPAWAAAGGEKRRGGGNEQEKTLHGWIRDSARRCVHAH